MKILSDEFRKNIIITSASGITLSRYTVGFDGIDIEGVHELSYFINKDFDLELGGYCVEKDIKGLSRTTEHGLTYRGLPARTQRAPFIDSHEPEHIDALSTIYEAAYSFIYEKALCCRNEGKRDHVRSFLCAEFKKFASDILVSDMDGLDIKSIQIMSDGNCNELWRNTVWFAASCGLIESSYMGRNFEVDKNLQKKYVKPEFNIF